MLKKSIFSLLAIVLTIGTVLQAPSQASAEVSDFEIPLDLQEMHFDSEEEAEAYIEEIRNAEFTTSGAVAVFVGGIIASFVIDGVIYHYTDFTAAQWVSIQMAYWNCPRHDPKANFIIFSNGNTACAYGSGGGM